jgi:hypothetical protein
MTKGLLSNTERIGHFLLLLVLGSYLMSAAINCEAQEGTQLFDLGKLGGTVSVANAVSNGQGASEAKPTV